MEDSTQKMDVGEKSKESIFWSLMVGPTLQVFQFAISIVIARILEPRDFGIMGIASVIIFYSNNISEFGFGDAIVRIESITKKHIDTFFTLNLGISFILFIVVFLMADYFAAFFELPELGQVLRVLSSIFIITSFYNIPQALLRRNLSYKKIAKIDVLRRIGGVSFTLTFAIAGFGYWALIYGTLSANLTAAVAILMVSNWKPRLRFYMKAFKDIVGFASWKFVSAQINILGGYLDKFIIGKVLGPVTLGYYEKSFGIAIMPVQQISQKIGSVMFSTFSRIRSEPDKIRHYFRRSITLVSVVCFPIFLGLHVVADHFVTVLLGEKWQPMIPSFKILLIAFLFSTLTTSFDILNLSCGNYKRQVQVKIFSLLVLCLLLLLYTRNGIAAVAYIIVVYNVLLLALSYLVSRKVSRLYLLELVKSIMPATLGTSFMFTLLTLCSMSFCADLSLISLVSMIILGVIFYVSFMFVANFESVGFLRKEFFLRLGSITKRFR